MRVLIDKEKAETILSKNNINRNMAVASQKYIGHLARLMSEGKWMYNGEPIIISDRGNLMDGQHRLHAVLKSGVSVEMEVIEGVPERAMPTIDTGKARSASDVLSMNGFPNSKLYSGLIRDRHLFNKKAFRITGGGSRSATTLSNDEVLKIALRDTELQDYIITSKQFPLLSGSEKTILNYVCCKTDPEKGKEFMSRLISGEGKKGDPILSVREVLLEDTRVITHYTKVQKIALVLKTFNVFLKGKKLSVPALKRSLAEPFPYPENYPLYEDL